MRPCAPPETTLRFTLIELLVVIAIIAILVGLLFPAFKAVQNQARSTQAKNDIMQIVNAVNAFYTDYGKYPVPCSGTGDCCFTWNVAGCSGSYGNDWLFNELRACSGRPSDPSCSTNVNTPVINTRQIVYISPPIVKDPTNPKSGIEPTGGNAAYVGQYFDPWGHQYNAIIDSSYDNTVPNPYGSTGGAGVNPIAQGVIGQSNGVDQGLGTGGNGIYTNSDDVISWQ